MANSTRTLREFEQKMDAGLQLAYEKLVRRKAKERGTLIYSINGKITEVPAKELLKQFSKSE